MIKFKDVKLIILLLLLVAIIFFYFGMWYECYSMTGGSLGRFIYSNEKFSVKKILLPECIPAKCWENTLTEVKYGITETKCLINYSDS